MIALNLAHMRHTLEDLPASGYDRGGRPFARRCVRCAARYLMRPNPYTRQWYAEWQRGRVYYDARPSCRREHGAAA